MRKLLLNSASIVRMLFYCLLLSGCTSSPPSKVPEWVGKMKNACLPEAIVMTQELRKSGIQAKVLSIHTQNWGHAMCSYLYPPGQNKLWVWDSHWQSIQLRGWWNDPYSVAKAWMNWRYDETPITNAYFHETK